MMQNKPLIRRNLLALLHKSLLVSIHYSSMQLPDGEEKALA